MKKFIINHLASWLIEATILITVGYLTLMEVRETNEKTQEVLKETQLMLQDFRSFASERGEGAGEAIDNLTKEVGEVKLEDNLSIDDLKGIIKDLKEKENGDSIQD